MEVNNSMNYFVTGTGTDIGKTIVTALLTDFLSTENKRCIAYKPIQTGAIKEKEKWLAPDPEVYKLINDTPNEDKAYTYLLHTASSPHLAARQENITFELDRIHQAIKNIRQNDNDIIVEGAGGLYVPITEDGYCMIHLIKEIAFPVILVADAGLGTINHTVLSVKALQAYSIPITGIILNGTGQEDRLLELDNEKMIKTLTDVPIIGTIPFTKEIQTILHDKNHRKQLTEDWNKNILKLEGEYDEAR